jgi:hypothetical protein
MMEPFTIRCETCRAKLRVRDERVLGQIHECPRCGSMVLIAAPGATAAVVEAKIQAAGAGASMESIAFPATASAASGDTMFAAAMPDSHAAAPVEAPPIDAATAAFDWSRVAFWSAGGAALFIAGGIVGAILLGGGDVETLPAVPTAEAAAVRQPVLPEANEAPTRPAKDLVSEKPVIASAEPTSEAESAPVTESSIVDAPVEQPATAPVVEPPQPAIVAAEVPQQETERKLTLEPVPAKASMSELAAELEAPAYATVVELIDVAPEAAKPQAEAFARPATNIDDQLAMPIVGMEINAMPLSSFVETISEMSAVPIVLDDATLKAAGVTARTKVSVRAGQETIESLLTKTLSRHKLAWEEHDGKIVIVPAR